MQLTDKNGMYFVDYKRYHKNYPLKTYYKKKFKGTSSDLKTLQPESSQGSR